MDRTMRDAEWRSLMQDVEASKHLQCKPQPGESRDQAWRRTYASAMGELQARVTAALMSMTRTREDE